MKTRDAWGTKTPEFRNMDKKALRNEVERLSAENSKLKDVCDAVHALPVTVMSDGSLRITVQDLKTIQAKLREAGYESTASNWRACQCCSTPWNPDLPYCEKCGVIDGA